MIRRARSLAVVGILLAGAIGLISATQTWIIVTLRDASAGALDVAGAGAVPLLAPLSLAALALGIALSIIGRTMRYVFGVLAVAIAVTLGVLTITVIAGPPVSSIAPVVTDHTAIAGESSVAELVASTTQTAWPIVSLACWVLLLAAAILTLATAHTWKAGGRRYRTANEPHAAATGPLDAVDSWDDLSRGEDPTR